LPSESDDPEVYADALYGGGCDDALIGIGKKGYIALDFSRMANTKTEAMESAIQDVLKVVPGAALIDS